MSTKQDNSLDATLEAWRSQLNDFSSFELLATDVTCIRSAVVSEYLSGYSSDNIAKTPSTTRINNLQGSISQIIGKTLTNLKISTKDSTYKNFDANSDDNVRLAANWVWNNKGTDYIDQNILQPCAAKNVTSNLSNNLNTSKNTQTVNTPSNTTSSTPFDRRMDRLEIAVTKDKNILGQPYTPFSGTAEVATSGYLINPDTLINKGDFKDKKNVIEAVKNQRDQMSKNNFYLGVPALQNQYATIRLYGSNGGQYLMNQKNQRRWYEVDVTKNNDYNFASTPTTTALINWGNGDPFGRTPYQFTDFVFAKYWNRIENNRLITLRRYAAPVFDNLKFPGMSNAGNTPSSTSSDTAIDPGSTVAESIPFPPMASAITYFGGETGNSLNNILKFTTGVLWDDAQAAVWEVNTDSVPDANSGPGAYGGIAKFAEMLNVMGGNFDLSMVMNKGQLPPDPYENGPYENRIKGPVNRIDSVKKRKPGLAFSWDGLELNFEYVGRPIGGINTKAALLDILSNFLVIGSASAVFFGGAHRFMAVPAKYPFLGGSEGIQKWYKGDPIGWGLASIKQFTGTGTGSGEAAGSNLLKSLSGFFEQLFSGDKGSGFGAIQNLFTGGAGNLIKNEVAKKSAGQIPFLSGMKAILTGEPVGEWHITVGNPLNPIAMIGNLICEGITVEFNEELGPDDFPTEMKIKVKLTHAMARDRDAIESVFNRGMGRIYQLPDSFLGTADYQTTVDNATKDKVQTGVMPNRRYGILYQNGATAGYIPLGQTSGKPNPMGGSVSVWNRSAFSLGTSQNSTTQFLADTDEVFTSAYRTANWIAQRALL